MAEADDTKTESQKPMFDGVVFGEKYCPFCKTWKNFDDFSIVHARRSRKGHLLRAKRMNKCKTCCCQYQKRRVAEMGEDKKKWYRNKCREVGWKVRLKIRLTCSEYEQMLGDQNGVCAICQCQETLKDRWTGSLLPLSVDHDHATGQLRELLCRRCNSVLGYLNDNIELLRKFVTYLQRHGKQ